MDLTATKITEHEDQVAEAANDKLLKVAAIYGANASGKSNVYDAFEYMTYYVYESFKFGDEEERRRKTGLCLGLGSHKQRAGFSSGQGVYESPVPRPQPMGQNVPNLWTP